MTLTLGTGPLGGRPDTTNYTLDGPRDPSPRSHTRRPQHFSVAFPHRWIPLRRCLNECLYNIL